MALQLEEDKHLILRLVQQQVRAAGSLCWQTGRMAGTCRPAPRLRRSVPRGCLGCSGDGILSPPQLRCAAASHRWTASPPTCRQRWALRLQRS